MSHTKLTKTQIREKLRELRRKKPTRVFDLLFEAFAGMSLGNAAIRRDPASRAYLWSTTWAMLATDLQVRAGQLDGIAAAGMLVKAGKAKARAWEAQARARAIEAAQAQDTGTLM